jgi:hypothetical protein
MPWHKWTANCQELLAHITITHWIHKEQMKETSAATDVLIRLEHYTLVLSTSHFDWTQSLFNS